MMNPATLKIGATGIATVAAVSTYLTIRKLLSLSQERKNVKERTNRLIVITGCDTGLGYSMAVWGSKLGYKVIAGCLNETGEGAQKLKQQFRERIIVTGLNVTDATSLNNFQSLCRQVLQSSEGKLKLWAVIANAAVCTIGEFFWQTRLQCQQQMDVNFWGSVNFISEFRNLLFENKSRVIMVGSDCSDYPLPYLSVYSATKAALNSWTRAFRLEVAKYGIQVVAYEPRGFAGNTGLFANVEAHQNQMWSEMSASEKKFYGDYFDKFLNKKQEVFELGKQNATKLLDTKCHRQSLIHLLEGDIRYVTVFRDCSIIENVFHGLYKYLPQSWSDAMVQKALNPDSICWIEPKQEHAESNN